MAPTVELKLSEQEQNVLNYLTGKSKVAWEELAQFSKNPQAVKRNTLLKIVSDLRKKYKTVGLPDPIACQFFDMVKTGSNPPETVQAEVVSPPMVQMRKTLGGNLVRADDTTPDAHIDFKMDKFNRRVRTKNGPVNLNENDYELFEIFMQHAGKPLSKEDLRDAVFPQYGSKLKPSWWDDIAGRMTRLRMHLPELKTQNRLLTMKGGFTTFYMLK